MHSVSEESMKEGSASKGNSRERRVASADRTPGRPPMGSWEFMAEHMSNSLSVTLKGEMKIMEASLKNEMGMLKGKK